MSAPTVRVRFEPSGRELVVPAGTTLFQATRAAGLPLGSSCDGEGICGRCGLRLLAGALSPPGAREERVKRDNDVEPGLRLSCHARILSDVVVTTDYW